MSESGGLHALKEQAGRLQELVAELEAILDGGFFVSIMGRVVVDEKRLLSLLNELRMVDLDATAEIIEEEAASSGAHGYPPPPRKPPETADEMLQQAYEDAETVRRGADEYARQVLENLEQKLESFLESVKQGQEVLDERRIER
mgnify:CR=1 FL=1